MKDLKALGLGVRDQWYTSLQSDALKGISIEWDFKTPSSSIKEMESEILNYDFCCVEGPACLNLQKLVSHRSVGSHFLNYMDFLKIQNGKIWGKSIFSLSFFDVFLQAIKNQDYKGSVIFLGQNELALPTLDVLARFGCEDFVFLTMDEDEDEETPFHQTQAGLFNTKISTVNSGAFIQSQKEYTFCFVMEDAYPAHILDDMSYFHFLSSNSIVVDLSGRSNFLFKEVIALGVDVIQNERILSSFKGHLAENIAEVATL